MKKTADFRCAKDHSSERQKCLSLSLSLQRPLERWPWGPRIINTRTSVSSWQRGEGWKEGGGRGWRERDTEPGGKGRTMSPVSKALRWCAWSWMDICEVQSTDFSFWCHMEVSTGIVALGIATVCLSLQKLSFGDLLDIPVVKSPCCQCRGCGFDPWPGN